MINRTGSKLEQRERSLKTDGEREKDSVSMRTRESADLTRCVSVPKGTDEIVRIHREDTFVPQAKLLQFVETFIERVRAGDIAFHSGISFVKL